MTGSQFGGAGGFVPSAGSGQDRYGGYFTSASQVHPTTTIGAAPTGFGAPTTNVQAGVPADQITSGRRRPSMLTLAVAVLLLAVVAFAGFKWWHRNDPVIPDTLGGVARVDDPRVEAAIDTARKQAGVQGQDAQLAGAIYGTGPAAASLIVIRKEGIGDQFSRLPAGLVHAHGPESCISSKQVSECYRAAGDVLVMVIGATSKSTTEADIAGWTEEAFRAQ